MEAHGNGDRCGGFCDCLLQDIEELVEARDVLMAVNAELRDQVKLWKRKCAWQVDEWLSEI